jgi:hypothetical protein
MWAASKKLKDGTLLDPNLYCPSCEVILVNEAAIRGRVRHPSAVDIERWTQECLRKDAFAEAHQARRVAKQMRRRNRGAKFPVNVYRCRIAIDPVMFPDRASPHWHIGGSKTP